MNNLLIFLSLFYIEIGGTRQEIENLHKFDCIIVNIDNEIIVINNNKDYFVFYTLYCDTVKDVKIKPTTNHYKLNYKTL